MVITAYCSKHMVSLSRVNGRCPGCEAQRLEASALRALENADEWRRRGMELAEYPRRKWVTAGECYAEADEQRWQAELAQKAAAEQRDVLDRLRWLLRTEDYRATEVDEPTRLRLQVEIDDRADGFFTRR